MKKIVILGGGFAGVAAALALKKELARLDAHLTLIDKRDAHLFTPSLYEVATSEEPHKNISIPFYRIVGNDIKILKRRIIRVDTERSKVILTDDDELGYDYLLISLGSQTAYFGIEGLEENSLPLKNLNEAVHIKETILEKYEAKKDGPLRIFIGGGGFSGTELAAEMVNYREHLIQSHPGQMQIEIGVIEGTERLLNGLDQSISDLAKERLEKDSVKIYLNSFIEKVTEKQILIKGGEHLDYDILIWTGGIVPNSLAKESGLPTEKRGSIIVNSFLQAQSFENIFSAGDVTCYTSTPDQKPAPAVAQVAEEEGKVAGENIARLIKGEPLNPYKFHHFGYVVPIKGRFAVSTLGGIYWAGFFGWVLQQVVFLRYLLGILPFPAALAKWNKFELELEK